MIINFKIFEKIDKSVLENFLRKYDEYKNDPWYKKHVYRQLVQKSIIYGIPTEFYYEVELLYYLYNASHNLANALDKNIKNAVKRYALSSLLKKFDEDPNLYYKLKRTLNDRPMDEIYDLTMKYIFFLFHTAIKKSTKLISNTIKYNL